MTDLSPLPPPRRIITWHEPTGECTAIDETIPMVSSVGGLLQSYRGFVQTDFPGQPDKSPEYAQENIQGFIHSKGLGAFFIDFKPNFTGPIHFSNSFDYIILTQGTLVLETTNGQEWTVNPGELVVNAANIHAWHNRTNEWARMFGVLSPAVEVTANGKNLKELHPDARAIPTLQ